jgi:hypothetical protein
MEKRIIDDITKRLVESRKMIQESNAKKIFGSRGDKFDEMFLGWNRRTKEEIQPTYYKSSLPLNSNSYLLKELQKKKFRETTDSRSNKIDHSVQLAKNQMEIDLQKQLSKQMRTVSKEYSYERDFLNDYQKKHDNIHDDMKTLSIFFAKIKEENESNMKTLSIFFAKIKEENESNMKKLMTKYMKNEHLKANLSKNTDELTEKTEEYVSALKSFKINDGSDMDESIFFGAENKILKRKLNDALSIISKLKSMPPTYIYLHNVINNLVKDTKIEKDVLLQDIKYYLDTNSLFTLENDDLVPPVKFYSQNWYDIVGIGGLIVRKYYNEASKIVTVLSNRRKIHVIEMKGNCAKIDAPTKGWVTIKDTTGRYLITHSANPPLLVD